MTDVVLLVHGGLYEDMDANRFWEAPGVADGLAAAGFQVLAPDRLRQPPAWTDEAAALATALRGAPSPAGVVAGSNGCSAALRLALDYPDLVKCLVLAWPAAAGVPELDARARARIDASAEDGTADRLLTGNTVRGVADAELRHLDRPVTIVPSLDEDPFHPRATVETLAALLPDAHVTAPFPPTPHAGFAERRTEFVETVADALRS